MRISTLILLPLCGALLNALFALTGSRRGRPLPEALISFVGVCLPVAAFAVALKLGWPLLRGENPSPLSESLFSWMAVGRFKVEAGLWLDRLSWLMTLLVTGVGSLIHLYSTGYMKGDRGYARYFACLNLFLASMLILVLADNLLFLFVGWEGVGLCSYLLIGFWFEDSAKAYAGKKAFVVNRIGDVGFLLAVLTLIAALLPSVQAPSAVLNVEFLRTHAPALASVGWIVALCLFVGATGKSAQIPLYVWLPDAMAGPTAVSALIHAATMVTAGIYMIARLHFLYDLFPEVSRLIAIVGVSTALFAGLIALVQNDIKKVLAYSTVSQLGYMFLGVGVGAYSAGVFHLLTHAFFKACLFLGAGSVIHALSGEQDLRKMGGLRRRLPVTFWTFLFATVAIAGLPPFSGFFSKDEILWQAYQSGHKVLWAMGMLTAALTSFYMFRLLTLAFLGKSRLDEQVASHLHESPFSMGAVLVVLALLSAGAGVLNVPHALGGHAWLHGWLPFESGASLSGPAAAHEVSAHGGSAAHERMLAAASALVAALAALGALKKYLRPSPVSTGPRGELARLLANKFYVDEFYDAAIVRPLQNFSRGFLARGIEKGLVDGGLVHGSARLTGMLGRLVNFFQNGLVNDYVLYFLFGLLGLLGLVFFIR